MGEVLRYVTWVVPRLFGAYAAFCAAAAVVFGLGACFYVYPLPTTVMLTAFFLGTRAHVVGRYAASHIHLAAWAHSLNLHG